MTETIVLTGASGFIAKHILVKLLNAGYAVRGSLRSLSRADEVIAAITPHLADPDIALARLSFVVLDLNRDDGWPQALAGADILMHTASPFPMTQPENEDELIRPAVDGTRRALSAAQAAGVRRVVQTSSAVAVLDYGQEKSGASFTEEDWTDPNAPTISPYVKSKTLAEQAAWDFAKAHPEMRLTVINPGFVLGPPLDNAYGTSVRVIERLLRGKDPMLPNIGFSTVDVRDVAEMHLRALTRPGTEGKRFLAASDFLNFVDLAKAIAGAFPDRRIVTRRAPDIVVRILALFDKTIRSIVPALGVVDSASNARARQVMGMDFMPPAEAAIASARALIASGRFD